MVLGWPGQRTDAWLTVRRASGEGVGKGGGWPPLAPAWAKAVRPRGWTPAHPVADDDAAVGDPGPVPACPVLGVLAPVLEEDVADTWRVI